MSRARDTAVAAAQHGLLFGFAAVAAGISAHGLTGFARDNMRLAGPWPYLLFFALDGAAGLCAVLLLRRAARGETAVAPRLAVWGLVAASSIFNWTHAPRRPGAHAAFALMPVVAALLFEFSLRETRRRNTANQGRRLGGQRWLRPAERIRVHAELATDETLTAHAATNRVRAALAARRLYQLRQAQPAGDNGTAGRRFRRAERRARAALVRAGFTDPAAAAEVLRQAQILALTPALAALDYTTPEAAHAAMRNLIGVSPPYASPRLAIAPNGFHPLMPTAYRNRSSVPDACGYPLAGFGRKASRAVGAASGDGAAAEMALVEAARAIVAAARQRGAPLSQSALVTQLRAQGYTIANGRLRWLSDAAGLDGGRNLNDDVKPHRR